MTSSVSSAGHFRPFRFIIAPPALSGAVQVPSVSFWFVWHFLVCTLHIVRYLVCISLELACPGNAVSMAATQQILHACTMCRAGVTRAGNACKLREACQTEEIYGHDRRVTIALQPRR